jgi:hypothetical protein
MNGKEGAEELYQEATLTFQELTSIGYSRGEISAICNFILGISESYYMFDYQNPVKLGGQDAESKSR